MWVGLSGRSRPSLSAPVRPTGRAGGRAMTPTAADTYAERVHDRPGRSAEEAEDLTVEGRGWFPRGHTPSDPVSHRHHRHRSMAYRCRPTTPWRGRPGLQQSRCGRPSLFCPSVGALAVGLAQAAVDAAVVHLTTPEASVAR